MRRLVFSRGLLALLGLGSLLGASAIRAEEETIGELSAEAQNLVRLLNVDDLTERQAAFMELEALRDPATLPVIRPYLSHKHADLRSFAVRAVAAIDGVAAVPELVERLKSDRSPTVRIAVILALEPLQDPAILPAFIQRLRDRSPEVRMAALDAVSRFKQPEAREAILLRQRRERHRDVQRVLEDALRRVESS